MSFLKKMFSSKNKEEEVEKEPDKKFGTVSVENNVFTVTNPVNCEEYAAIIIPQNDQLMVLIDGTQRAGKVELTESSKIEVDIKDAILKEPIVTLKPIVSKDKLEVSLKKEITKGERIQIKETSLSKEIELELIKNPFAPEPMLKESLELSLEEFKGTILEEGLEKVRTSSEPVEEVVLRGTPAIDATPAYYEQMIEVSEINFIQKNEALAKLIEEVPGIDGVDVHGEPLLANQESKMAFLGEGVEDRDGILYSTREGRLIFSETEIDIYPQLVIPRDLEEEDGDIIFDDGDIIIHGSILEKCFIKAKGMVIVEGGVHHSTIFTQHGVTIKGNASKSTIYSGWVLFYKKIASDILETVLSLEKSFDRITEKYQDEKDKKNQLIDELIKQKYQEIINKVDDASHYIIEQTPAFNKPFLKIFAYIDEEWKGQRHLPSRTKIEEFKDVLEEYIAFLEEVIWNEPAHVTTMSITASEIFASGNITVNGTGSYQSNIVCDGNLTIKEKLTGGQVTASKKVEVGEYKSFNTNEYFIKTTDEDSQIKIGVLHPDSLLICSEFEHINYDIQKNVLFKAKDERKKQQDKDKDKETKMYTSNKNKG